MALKGNPNIDIPLDGVGAQPDAVRRSRAPIDIPLDGRGDDPAQISRLELEMVHAEVKALYRRAQKGE